MEALVLIASVVSAIVVGIEADLEDWEGWFVINGLLLLVFWADVIFKLRIFGMNTYCNGTDRHWNRFDFITTLLSTCDWLNEVIRDWGFPTANAIPLRVLRIARLARFVRGTFFKDLNALIYGFLYGLRPLFWAVFVLLIVSYALGLMMRLYVGKEDSASPYYGPIYFGDVRTSMYNIFRCINSDCTTLEGFPLVLRIGDSYGWLPKISYAVIVLTLTLGLLNVVLALFVERVLEGAKYSETMRHRLEAKEANFIRSIRSNFGFIDDLAEAYYAQHPQDLTGEAYLTISRGFFKELLHSHRFIDMLHKMGIRLEDLGITGDELFEVLSPDSMPLSFDNMLQEISMMRGEARVTLQILSLAVQNKTMRLVERLCDKFNVKYNDYITPAEVSCLDDGNRGTVLFQGITRQIALGVGVAMKETE